MAADELDVDAVLADWTRIAPQGSKLADELPRQPLVAYGGDPAT